MIFGYNIVRNRSMWFVNCPFVIDLALSTIAAEGAQEMDDGA